jgi:hypothetical protein
MLDYEDDTEIDDTEYEDALRHGDLDDRRDGCQLGDKCCCPHPFHSASECFDAEWAERYFAEDLGGEAGEGS